MKQRKLAKVCCLALLCYASAGSAPIATSQLTYDLSSAFISLGSGTILSSFTSSSSYVHSEDGSVVQEQNLTGDGTISATASGAMASATANFGSATDLSEATTIQGVATAHSRTTTELIFNVEQVDVFNMSLDLSAFMNLTTDVPLDYAYGSWDDYFALYYFDGTNQTLLTSDQFTFGWETIDGESANYSQNNILNLSHDFGGNAFTGQLLVQNIAQTYAETQSSAPSPVPEPSGTSLMILGLATLLPLIKRRKA